MKIKFLRDSTGVLDWILTSEKLKSYVTHGVHEVQDKSLTEHGKTQPCRPYNTSSSTAGYNHYVFTTTRPISRRWSTVKCIYIKRIDKLDEQANKVQTSHRLGKVFFMDEALARKLKSFSS